MNYRNILGLGLIAVSTLMFQSAVAKPASSLTHLPQAELNSFMRVLDNDPISPGPPAQPLQPIRQAKGTFQIIRSVMSFDSTTGMETSKQDIICTRNVDVGVYDNRGQNNTYVSFQNFQCADNYEGEAIKVVVASVLLLTNQSLLGQPPQDLKNFLSYAYAAYANGSKLLPKIPSQATFTKDLNQVYFGTINAPEQYVMCTSEPIVGEPIPKPRPQSTPKCEVTNPVAYQVVWEVEDRP